MDKRLKSFELALKKIWEAQAELEDIGEWDLSQKLNLVRTKIGARWRNIESAPKRKGKKPRRRNA